MMLWYYYQSDILGMQGILVTYRMCLLDAMQWNIPLAIGVYDMILLVLLYAFRMPMHVAVYVEVAVLFLACWACMP